MAMNGCGGATSPEARRPNVLLITVDSLRADRLGFAGHGKAATPSLDALASRSAWFTRAFTPVPDATPALASLHTGQYPATHGLRVSGADALAPSARTLAQAMKQGGYKTAAFVASLDLHPRYGLDRGFDRYGLAFTDEPRPSQVSEIGYVATKVADRTLEYLETARDGPFFLWVNFYDPHYFYNPPEPYRTRFADDLYDGEIAYVDHEIGRILDKLGSYAIKDTTIVVMTGSNGEGLGDHGEVYHGSILQGSTIRVPLLIAAPAFAPGTRVDQPVCLVDLAPTLLDLAGLPPLGSVEGVSLVKPASLDPQRPIWLETRMPETLFGWAPLTGVVSWPWKYVLGRKGDLYNLDTDPSESHDVSDAQTAERDRLAALVSAYAARGAGPRVGKSLAEAVVLKIRSMGFQTEPARREAKDPRDMIEVANDALKADRSLRRNLIDTGSFLLADVLKRDPGNYLGMLDAARLSHSKGDTGTERRLLETARDLYPRAGELYHELGHLALADKRDAPRAQALFEIATALDPLNEEALYDVACGHAVAGRKAEALDALALAVKAGFRDFVWMAADSDLDSVRSDPRFGEITGGMAQAAPARPPSKTVP